MWNPYQDGWQLIDEFLDNVYGPSAPYIREYIQMLQEKVKPLNVFFTIFADPTDGGYLTPETIHKAEELFAQAEKAASGNEALLKRVELAHLPVLYSRLYFYTTGGKAILNAQEMPAVLRKFERIIKEHNITQMAERKDRGDIDAFVKRVKSSPVNFITDWQIIGPFDYAGGKGLKVPYEPERGFNPAKSYDGLWGKVKWKKYTNDLSGYIDFTKIFKRHENGVAYAYRLFKSDRDKTLKVGIGSNDGARVWLNGKMVLDKQVLRKAEPNQDIINLPLKKGDNAVLIKVDQDGGGWGFYFSILHD